MLFHLTDTTLHYKLNRSRKVDLASVCEQSKPELQKVFDHLNVIEIVIDPPASCRSGNLLHIE